VEADISDLAPWEQRHDLAESSVAYHAFCHYRDLDTRDRTLNRAYNNHMTQCRTGAGEVTEGEPTWLRASGCWQDWKRDYRWDERVALKTAYEDRRERERQLQAIKDMNVRHAALGVKIQNQLVKLLEEFDPKTIQPKDLAPILKAATDVERRARGEATEIVQNETTLTVGVSNAVELRRQLRAEGILQEIEAQRDIIDVTPEPQS
jgi:hypothetical protein